MQGTQSSFILCPQDAETHNFSKEPIIIRFPLEQPIAVGRQATFLITGKIFIITDNQMVTAAESK